MGKIAEIFDSIQGEGVYVGQRQIFVRFFGCNMSCKFCDTKLTDYKNFEPDELLTEIKKFPVDFHSVSFTGGEPLLQKDFLKTMLEMTRLEGYTNYLETNGTLPEELADVIEFVDIVAMDFKLPSSTGQRECWEAHTRFLKIAVSKDVFVKAVICANTKDEDIEKSIELIKDTNKDLILILQPNTDDKSAILDIKLEKYKGMCTASQVKSRVIPQMHKILGVR